MRGNLAYSNDCLKTLLKGSAKAPIHRQIIVAGKPSGPGANELFSISAADVTVSGLTTNVPKSTASIGAPETACSVSIGKMLSKQFTGRRYRRSTGIVQINIRWNCCSIAFRVYKAPEGTRNTYDLYNVAFK